MKSKNKKALQGERSRQAVPVQKCLTQKCASKSQSAALRSLVAANLKALQTSRRIDSTDELDAFDDGGYLERANESEDLVANAISAWRAGGAGKIALFHQRYSLHNRKTGNKG